MTTALSIFRAGNSGSTCSEWHWHVDQDLDFDWISHRKSTDAGWLSSHGYASPSQTTKFFGLNLGFGRDLVGLRWAQIYPWILLVGVLSWAAGPISGRPKSMHVEMGLAWNLLAVAGSKRPHCRADCTVLEKRKLTSHQFRSNFLRVFTKSLYNTESIVYASNSIFTTIFPYAH